MKDAFSHAHRGLNLHRLWIYGLTVLGGYFNSGAIWLHQRPSSHHTGNLSALAQSVLLGDWPLALELLGVMLAFIAGTVLAGYLFHERKFKPSARYGLCLLSMGVLVLSAALLRPDGRFLLFMGAGFMGLQNGLFIFYKNTLVRTTHVTGTFTDFGFALGAYLRGQREEKQRVFYYGCSILSFLLGGFLAPLVLHFGVRVFWLGMALGYLGLGGFYFYLHEKRYFQV